MKRQKVVLYNPKSVFFDMPLALISIGSALDPQKYEVIIIDGRLESKPLQMVLEACEGALCFGVTALTGKPLIDAIRVTKAVRARNSNLPIVWGGWHPSLFPVETLHDEPSIDITVQGQGELTFSELVSSFSGHVALSEVHGITYRDQHGNITKNQKRHLHDMNELPRANYDLIDISRYFKAKGTKQLDYISSTGCNYRCTFCADPFVYDRAWTAIDPIRMGEELAYLKSKHGYVDVNFQDETFFTRSKRVRNIAEQILEQDCATTWAATMRADQGARLSNEEFRICKKSGLRRVLVGVESGTQEMMDWLKKDIKMEHVYQTANKCKENSIAVIFPFIVGFPQESNHSFNASLKMAFDLRSIDSSFETPIFYFKPYPGSAITTDMVSAGYQLPQTIAEWSKFDYIGSSGPWVSDLKYQKVERFKVYNKLAFQKRWYLKPFSWLARARCRHDYFKIPIEKFLIDNLVAKQSLS